MSKRSKIRNLLITLFIYMGVTSCDFVFEQQNKYSNTNNSSVTQSQKVTSQLVILAYNNIKTEQLCHIIISKPSHTEHTKFISRLKKDNTLIQKEIKKIADHKNISIPNVTRRTTENLAQKYQSIDYPNTVIQDIKLLLQKQTSTIKKILKNTTDDKVVKSSKKIKRILEKNIVLTNTLDSLEDTYTNL